jgi:hypothetical protein
MADETKKVGTAEKPEKEITLANVTKLFWVALSILIFLLILSIEVPARPCNKNKQ